MTHHYSGSFLNMAAIRLRLMAALTFTSVSAIQLWKSPGEISNNVPARCKVPLTRNITCDFLVSPGTAANGEMLVGEAADVYCSSTCRSSLESFKDAVTASCGNTHYAMWENSTMEQSGQYIAEGFLWAHSLVCLSDECV